MPQSTTSLFKQKILNMFYGRTPSPPPKKQTNQKPLGYLASCFQKGIIIIIKKIIEKPKRLLKCAIQFMQQTFKQSKYCIQIKTTLQKT